MNSVVDQQVMICLQQSDPTPVVVGGAIVKDAVANRNVVGLVDVHGVAIGSLDEHPFDDDIRALYHDPELTIRRCYGWGLTDRSHIVDGHGDDSRGTLIFDIVVGGQLQPQLAITSRYIGCAEPAEGDGVAAGIGDDPGVGAWANLVLVAAIDVGGPTTVVEVSIDWTGQGSGHVGAACCRTPLAPRVRGAATRAWLTSIDTVTRPDPSIACAASLNSPRGCGGADKEACSVVPYRPMLARLPLGSGS